MEAQGQLEQSGDQWTLRYTRSLRHAPDKVWRALTEPAQLKAWFPDEVVGDFVEGATLRFEPGEFPGFDGKVITVDPPHVLEFTWADDTLRFELRAVGSGTVLTFTDTFGELGKAARDGAGWHVCLDRLGHALDGSRPPSDTVDQWREVHPGYVERLGPEASTIGPPPATRSTSSARGPEVAAA